MDKPTQRISYYNEISLMMFGFGDSHKPNPNTVRLVEAIVCKQLRVILQEAAKYAVDQPIQGEHLIFLLRRNTWKMRRFVKYLLNKKQVPNTGLDITDIQSTAPSKKHQLLNFIESIDETGELTNLSEFDEILHERKIRAHRISMALDTKKYMEFSKARCASFSSRQITRALNHDKLKQWVDPKNTCILTDLALEVLSYYAYQTVAEITDYALLVRLDTRRTKDPLNNLRGAYYNADMFKGDDRFSGPNPDYSSAYRSGQTPITVAEITEVMRRFTTPQAGKLKFGKKLPATHYLFAL